MKRFAFNIQRSEFNDSDYGFFFLRNLRHLRMNVVGRPYCPKTNPQITQITQIRQDADYTQENTDNSNAEG